MKRLIVFIIVLFTAASVSGHSNILYGVSLDFDAALKEHVTDAAMSFFGTSDEPIGFDYDWELIIVRFSEGLERSVSINPSDFSVHGFRDDSKVSGKNEERFSGEQRKETAQKVFESIPAAYREELTYGGEKKLYSGTYEYTWHRYVNGVLVLNDHLKVEVDPYSGEIVSWRLSVFMFPKSQMRTVPAITSGVARRIAELKLNAKEMDFEPVLALDKTRPVWIVKVKSIYPVFAGVDAMDGRLLYSGAPRGEIPKGYAYGKDITVTENDLIRSVYGGEET